MNRLNQKSVLSGLLFTIIFLAGIFILANKNASPATGSSGIKGVAPVLSKKVVDSQSIVFVDDHRDASKNQEILNRSRVWTRYDNTGQIIAAHRIGYDKTGAISQEEIVSNGLATLVDYKMNLELVSADKSPNGKPIVLSSRCLTRTVDSSYLSIKNWGIPYINLNNLTSEGYTQLTENFKFDYATGDFYQDVFTGTSPILLLSDTKASKSFEKLTGDTSYKIQVATDGRLIGSNSSSKNDQNTPYLIYEDHFSDPLAYEDSVVFDSIFAINTEVCK